MPDTRGVAVAAALALSAAVVGGCGRLYQRPPTTGAAEPCAGQSYLDVNNSGGASLELYGYVGPGSSTSRFLGSVAPGRQRIILTEPVGGVYAEKGGQRVTQNGLARESAGGITITRGCEPRE